MTIRIIEDEILTLTRADFDRFRREYDQSLLYMVNPPSFESWVRARQMGPRMQQTALDPEYQSLLMDALPKIEPERLEKPSAHEN